MARVEIGQWWAICHGFRRWALEQPSDFALLFGTPAPGYQAPEQLTGPAAGRAITVALAVYAAAVDAGAADPARVPPTLEVGDLLLELLGDAAPSLPAQLAGIALNAFASLRGFLATEIFGGLTRLVKETDQLYQAHARTVLHRVPGLNMAWQPYDSSVTSNALEPSRKLRGSRPRSGTQQRGTELRHRRLTAAMLRASRESRSSSISSTSPPPIRTRRFFARGTPPNGL